MYRGPRPRDNAQGSRGQWPPDRCYHRPLGVIVILAVFVAALAVLLIAVAPGVHWFDGGELVAAAQGLGISHPPGQPAHALLGKLFTFIPLGPMALRVGLASVVPTAALAAAAAALTRGLLRHALAGTPAARERRGLDLAAGLVGFAAIVPVFVAGQATRVEVYALCALLWIAGLHLLVRWDGRDGRPPLAAALLVGLGVSAHPLIGACSGLALAAAVLFVGGRRVLRLRLAAGAVAAAIVGLSSWAYVPLRGHAAPLFAWGDSRSLDGLVAIASGRDYWMNLGGSSGGSTSAMTAQIGLLGSVLGWPTLILALVGVAFLARRRAMALLAAGGLASALAVMLPARRFLADNPDTQGKMAVAAVLVVVLAGVAFVAASAHAAAAAPRLGAGRRGVALRLVAALALFVSVALSPGALRARSFYTLPETYALAALEAAPPRALALVSQDHLAFPALYLQLVEGHRPDVALAVVGLCGNRWHLQALARRHPHLAVPTASSSALPVSRGSGPLQERVALAMARGSSESVPVLVEPPSSLPGVSREDLGLALPWLILDAESRDGAPLLRVADREHDVHPERYVDSGARIYRITRLQRAFELSARGRPREAARVLAAAMGRHASRRLRPVVASLPTHRPAPEGPGAPTFGPLFISEPDQPAVALAVLLVDAGHPAAASTLLSPWATGRAAAVRVDQSLARGTEDLAQALAPLEVLDPGERGQAIRWLALRAVGRGRAVTALALLEELGDDDEALAEALVAVGVAFGRAGDPEAAAPLLERATDLAPTLVEAWTNLGVARAQLDQLDDARRAFRRALEVSPSDPAATQYLEALERRTRDE